MQIVYSFRKIPKISPGAYIFQRPFLRGFFLGSYIRRGLSTEANLRLKIDWASLILERKFIVFALFYFVFESNFQVQAPGGLILTDGVLRYVFALFYFVFESNFQVQAPGGLILTDGVLRYYIWRGLFSEFYGIVQNHLNIALLNVF